MSVVTYLKNGLYPGHFVYAVLCQDGDDGPLYIKFGRTHRLHTRLNEVAQGSPIPAKWLAFVEVPEFKVKAVEKALHMRFALRKTRGEWFKFDAKSKDDVREFNDGSNEVFRTTLKNPAGWNKVKASSLASYSKHKQSVYLKFHKSDSKPLY